MTHAEESQKHHKTDDFSGLSEGDKDPCQNKRIKRLIYCERDFIVYISDDLRIHISTSAALDAEGEPDGYGWVSGKVSELQATSGVLLQNRSLLEEFRAMVAEAYVRIFKDRHEKNKHDTNAKVVLTKAEKLLDVWALESARKSYVLTCLCVSLFSLLAIIVLWTYRAVYQEVLGYSAFDVMIGSLLGAPGAMISVYQRLKDLPIDSKSRQSTHYTDASVRIFAAMLGALLVALSVKANIVGGFVSAGATSSLLFVVCLVAGASERLVPSLISQVEKDAKKGKPQSPEEGAH